MKNGYYPYPKRDPKKNFFMVPNEIFSIGLDYREISLYAYLLRCENRETYQCYPSYKIIGKSIGMSENTVAKYVRQLEEKGLIYTEPTIVQSKDGKPLNGNLRYTIRPIQGAVETFYERQLRRMEEDAARQRAAERLAESARESPQNALCTPFGAEASPSADLGLEAQFDPLSETIPRTKEKAGRKDWRLCAACPPTTSRSAGGSGDLKQRFSGSRQCPSPPFDAQNSLCP